MPIPPNVVAQEAAADAAATRGGGEVVVYFAMRGGKPCNLSIQVRPGIPPQKDAWGQPIPGTGTPSKMLEFGKNGNPPGVLRTSDPEEQKLIQNHDLWRRGMIQRADVKKLSEIKALIKSLEARGLKLDKGLVASVDQRIAAATGGFIPPVVAGVRTTRTQSTGQSQPFGGTEALVNDPLFRKIL